MTAKFPYDVTQDPPAPIVPVRVGTLGGRWAAAVPFLVDTGADVSVIPARLARDLRLPALGEMPVQGATGRMIRVLVYGAELEIAGVRLSVPVAGFGRETLIGRDVINRWTLLLRGPEQSLEVETGSVAAR